jgi:ribosomal protein S18 acetylase RimI-like enzyme
MNVELKKVPEFSLQPAGPEDEDFALGIYLVITRQYLGSVTGWGDERIIERFRQLYDPAQVKIVCVDGVRAGWMQVSTTKDAIHLEQLHLIEVYRRRGIGTQVVLALQAEARSKGEVLHLNVMRGNSATEFYRRLGFVVTGADKEKYHLHWSPLPHVQ